MNEEPKFLETQLKRRDFLTKSALLGGSVVVGAQTPWLVDILGAPPTMEIKPTVEYSLARPENIIYSVCQQCNGQCGIKVKLKDGVAVKIDGSPFSPWTMRPHLPYDTSVFDTATADGGICPKGQAGIQTEYDPYRVRTVLKRA